MLERAGESRFAKKKPPIPAAEWRAVVGPRIADRARPIAIERGVLVVRVTTSVWANELQMLAPELLRRLVERGFAIAELRFRVGPLDFEERPPERRAYRKIPGPAPLAPELERSIQEIEDTELRDAISAAARANLAWQTQIAPSATGAKRGARAPRGAGTRSAPQARSEGGSAEASRRTNAGDSYRRR